MPQWARRALSGIKVSAGEVGEVAANWRPEGHIYAFGMC